MSPERGAAPRGAIAIESLSDSDSGSMSESDSGSPERAQGGLATGMSLDGSTPERPAASPPTELRHGRAPPDPTDSTVWFPVGDLRALDIRDAAQHPATYVRECSCIHTPARTRTPHTTSRGSLAHPGTVDKSASLPARPGNHGHWQPKEEKADSAQPDWHTRQGERNGGDSVPHGFHRLRHAGSVPAHGRSPQPGRYRGTSSICARCCASCRSVCLMPLFRSRTSMDSRALCAPTTAGHTKSWRRVRCLVDARLAQVWCSLCTQCVRGRMASCWVRLSLSCCLRPQSALLMVRVRLCAVTSATVGFEKIARTIFEDDDF